MLRLSSRLCFLPYLFMSSFFFGIERGAITGGVQVISFSTLHYVSLVAHCGGGEEENKKGFG